MPDAVDSPNLQTHPLARFLSAFQAARDQLVREQIEQEGVAKDGGASVGERADAQANVAELISVIGQLDDARTTFLVRVFTGVIPPSEELVSKSVKLNKRLAKATVQANRPGAYVRIVTKYLNGVTQVIGGNVPAAPTSDSETPTHGVAG